MIVKLENVNPVSYAQLCKFLASADNSYLYNHDGFSRGGKLVRLLKAKTPENVSDGKLQIELEVVESYSSRENMMKLFDALNIFPNMA